MTHHLGIGIAAAGGCYEVSYVELGTLLPGMGQGVEMNEPVSDETTFLEGQGNKLRGERMDGREEWEGKEGEKGCGGATQVAIFRRKDVDVRPHQHPLHHPYHHDASMSVPRVPQTQSQSQSQPQSQSQSETPSQSQLQSETQSQSHLYWRWCVNTGSFSSSQRKDAQLQLKQQSQSRKCREDID